MTYSKIWREEWQNGAVWVDYNPLGKWAKGVEVGGEGEI